MNTHRQLNDERGSVAVGGLLLSFALVLLIGTGVDIAHAFIVRRHLVAIADAAALDGSQQLNLNAWRNGNLALDPSSAEHAAQDELDADATISGAAQAQPDSITVEARQRLPTIVLRLVGIPELTVVASASAAPRTP